ncbi:MAG: MATE family efflux transporter [Cytophagaceae bacterium]|nr:MATE family efflux transporter [Cytophagaceae bacterium]
MRKPAVVFRLYRAETLILSRLALPIVFGQLGIMLMGVADVIQVGHLETGAKFALDAAGVANGVWISVAIFGFNALYVVAPMVSKAHEEARPDEIGRLLRASLWVSLKMALFCVTVMAVLAFNFHWFGQNPRVTALATPFLLFLAASTVPMFLFTAFRQMSDGLSHTRVAMGITLSALLLNILLNYLLINGNWGFPPLGLNGSGIATLTARTYMALAIWGYVRYGKLFRNYLSLALNPPPEKRRKRGEEAQSLQVKIFRLGIPSGFQGFFEIAVFALASVMIGWLGEDQLAAHLIAINPASVTYMMVTGLATAGGIRVGAGMGQRNRSAVLKSGTTALVLGGAFMALCCLVFLTANEQIVSLYIRDEAVAPIAAGLLLIAGVFQFFDGIQAVSLGLLRGLADVNIPTAVTLFAYWVVGLPVGCLLTFQYRFDVTGIWIGLTAGLMVAAILLSWRFVVKARKLRFSHRIKAVDSTRGKK